MKNGAMGKFHIYSKPVPVIPLRFSKSEKEDIERAYATHFVDVKRTEQIKKEGQDKLDREGG